MKRNYLLNAALAAALCTPPAGLSSWLVPKANAQGQQANGFGCATMDEVEFHSMSCIVQSPQWADTYSHKETWIPDPLTPVKTIHVNFHIWQRSDGTGNLYDTPWTHQRLHTIIAWVDQNYWTNLAQVPALSYPTDFAPSTRIHVVLDSIYFYQDPSTDSTYFFGDTASASDNIAHLDPYVRSHYPERMHALPLHIKGGFYCPNGHCAGGYAGSGSVVSFYRHAPEMNISDGHDYWYSGHLTHEIGHLLGLSHLYESNTSNCHPTNFDFLWDVYDTTLHCLPNCEVCIIPGLNSNYMAASWPVTSTFVSALQMGVMQRRTVMSIGTYSTRNYVVGYDSQHTWDVTGDETWDFSMKFYQDLVVRSGATLTVKCVLEFVPEARLIIEPHARVVLDGGVLTNEGFYRTLWKGVEVWGNAGQDQSGGVLALHQGKLEIKDGGRIENAECGAMACARNSDGTLDMSKTGGIIIANEADFKNCTQAVRLMPWPDPNSSLSLNTVNRSRFTRTSFNVDSDYPGEVDFANHVELRRVYGINFLGCTFRNLRLDSAVSGSDELGKGIYSLDAKFNVAPYCPGPWLEPGHHCYAGEVRSSFEGLDHAIEAGDALTTRGFSVTETDFVNNICGVYANGVINPVVKNNHFTMGRRLVDLTGVDVEFDDIHRAVFTTESYATRIDDNTIVMDANAQSTAEGVVVGFVRDHNDVVFRNHVTGLVNGYVGEGINADPDNQTHIGMWWLCNENVGNDQDLYNRVFQDITIPAERAEHTVRLIQGANNRPADNSFNNTNPEGDFKSDNEYNNIVYWYRNDGQLAFEPEEVTPSYVAPQVATAIPANNCARRFLLTHVIGDHPTGTLANGMAVINTSKLAYGTTRYLYDHLIDGGSTDEVVQEIMGSWPSDAWELRNSLMAKSPYLSTEVLEEAVEKNIMPQAMLTEVLVANPEATQREGFLRWVQSTSSHPLPQYLVDLVVASWSVRTYRFTLESTMAGHHTDMTMAADLVLEEYQRDTIREPLDSLRAVWQIIRTRSARYAEALLDVQQHNFTAALTVVQNIPMEHALRGPAEIEQQRMLNIIGFLQDVYATGRDETALTSTEISALESIVDGQYDRPAAWAQNLLCFGYQHCRPPLTGSGGGGQRRYQPTLITAEEVNEPRLWAHPNPASQYTEFHYQLVNEPIGAQLIVRDIAGREERRFSLINMEGGILWDTRSVVPGTYIVELIDGPQRLVTNRVVVKP